MKTLFSTFPSHKIVRCNDCGHGKYNKWLDPKLVEQYYNSVYWQYWQSYRIDERAYNDDSLYLKDPRACGQYNFVKEYLANFKDIDMLEIGAAGGFISRLIRASHPAKVNLNVVEPGVEWAPYYSANNIHLIATFFPFQSRKKYNYVHGSGWLEHVVDIKQTARCLRNLLSDDGLLFIEVPDCNQEYYATESGDSPHIHFFSKQSLVMLFKQFGFDVLKINQFGLTWAEDVKRRKDPEAHLKIVQEAKLSELENIPRKEGQHMRALFRVSKS